MPDTSRAGPRVLVVEDDNEIADLVVRALAGVGIDADVADNGLDGLWMAREGGYGAIVLDLMLPEMNGLELCRTLRREGGTTAVLMLTAKSGLYDEIDGFEMGADDYLRKPFSPAVLTHRVQALLRRSSTGERVEVLERAGIRLELSTRRCVVDETHVSLTTKETTLLEALLRTGDSPLSRQAILNQVWGLDFDGDPNIVDVYIGYLRKKLGRKRVENVRSVGFRLQ